MSQTIKQIHLQKTGKVSDKWSSYIDVYDNLFLPYRDKNINLFEIGIQNGGSLDTWSSYFKNANYIVGSDIDQRCKSLTYSDPRVKLIVDNANSQETYNLIKHNCKALDIVIDDGSHRSIDILTSFGLYYPLLSPGGIYVIEDTHTLYWKDWGGEDTNPFNAYIFFKKMIDVMNIQFWGKEKSVEEYFSDFFKPGNLPSFITDGSIESIEFRNSLIIIKKALVPTTNGLGERWVTGTTDLVNQNVKDHHGNKAFG